MRFGAVRAVLGMLIRYLTTHDRGKIDSETCNDFHMKATKYHGTFFYTEIYILNSLLCTFVTLVTVI